MSGRRNIAILASFGLAVSLIAVSITAFLLTVFYNRMHIQALGEISREIIENQPEAEAAVLSAIKEYRWKPGDGETDNILQAYGYGHDDYLWTAGQNGTGFAVIGCGAVAFLAGGTMFGLALFFLRRQNTNRIKQLTDYLEKVNTGGDSDLFQVGEDDFSRLQDEIYKTVTELYQTRETAVEAKSNFAENLYNIAHQLKTPITSISLSAQMLGRDSAGKYAEQINRQLMRLTHLEESLLLLSRIDAGTLSLEREEVDVFTVLMLAADNLQALLGEAGVSVSIPETGGVVIYADMDWTMEAIMNLMKNCMEHTPSGGMVHCSYEENPLYTQIRIWDDGKGFAKEDIPHLFERFYRGKDAKEGGIGIGLALSRAIIESQNGTITARNLAGGGACFEVHFYSH